MIVMLRSSSFLKRTVCTPLMALTTVDLPCATCPMVPARRGAASAAAAPGRAARRRRSAGGAPMLMVACREMTSGDSGVSSAALSLDRSCHMGHTVLREHPVSHQARVAVCERTRIDLGN